MMRIKKYWKKMAAWGLCAMLITGCGKEKQEITSENITQKMQVPLVSCENYFEINSGKDKLDAFYENTISGKKEMIDIENFEEKDFSRCIRIEFTGEEYVVKYAKSFIDSMNEQEKEEVSRQQVRLIASDKQINFSYDEDFVPVEMYKHLIRWTGKPVENRKYTETVYFLADDDKLTYKDVMRAMVSSQSTDWIRHRLLATQEVENAKVRKGIYLEENGDTTGKYINVMKKKIRISDSMLMSYADEYQYTIEGNIIKLYRNDKNAQIQVIDKNTIMYEGVRYIYHGKDF